jgi:hypothetical protein
MQSAARSRVDVCLAATVGRFRMNLFWGLGPSSVAEGAGLGMGLAPPILAPARMAAAAATTRVCWPP